MIFQEAIKKKISNGCHRNTIHYQNNLNTMHEVESGMRPGKIVECFEMLCKTKAPITTKP